jgi:hypothetical protein
MTTATKKAAKSSVRSAHVGRKSAPRRSKQPPRIYEVRLQPSGEIRRRRLEKVEADAWVKSYNKIHRGVEGAQRAEVVRETAIRYVVLAGENPGDQDIPERADDFMVSLVDIIRVAEYPTAEEALEHALRINQANIDTLPSGCKDNNRAWAFVAALPPDLAHTRKSTRKAK